MGGQGIVAEEGGGVAGVAYGLGFGDLNRRCRWGRRQVRRLRLVAGEAVVEGRFRRLSVAG